MIILKELGFGEITIQLTISEYKSKKTVRLPNKSKIWSTFKDKLDDFERNDIRRHVHEFWFKKQLPTLNKMLAAINKHANLQKVHSILDNPWLEFRVRQTWSYSVLIEREDIVLWCKKYIKDIRKYWAQGRPVYYLNETWVNVEHRWLQRHNVKCNRDTFLRGFIVVHIGSEEGFVDGGLLVFESKKGSTDYHEVMNGDVFFNWLKGVIPLLKDNSV